MVKIKEQGQAWWCTPFIPALEKQRQVNLCEFKAIPVYIASSKITRATRRNPVLGRERERERGREGERGRHKRKGKEKENRFEVKHLLSF